MKEHSSAVRTDRVWAEI